MKKILFFLLVINSVYAQPPGEWTWMKGSTVQNASGVFGTQGVPNPANTPPAFYEAVEWTDLEGNFWLFGGSDASMGLWADLWKYNPVTNQWTWMKGPGVVNAPGIYGTQGVPAPANYPPARVAGGTWVDESGNLWLCGGGNYFTSPYNDLWRYNIATNEWVWMNGSNTPNAAGVYGTLGIPAPGNRPGARTELGTTWSDNNYLWLFGGYGLNNTFSTGALSDVWRYDMSTNEWTWMHGTQNIGDPVVYGTIGVPNAANTPGGRHAYTKWKDAGNNFWFFGGQDYNSDNYSDLWKYNPGTGIWTWMSGSNLTNQPGIQGTPCTPAAGNRPVSKYENRCCWTDDCGNFWSFGGTDDGGFSNTYSDLWVYNPPTNEWSFIDGSMTSNVTPVYGTVAVSAPTNRPGGRCGNIGWYDVSTGNLFMFGGGIPTFPTCRNDMWRYVLPACASCDSLLGMETVINPVNEETVTVYPNPASDELTISLPSTSEEDVEIKIYDSIGRELLKTFSKKTNTLASINTKELNNGIYFLQINTGKNILNSCIVITHNK